MRPLLAPGAHVLRRPDGRLQVGLDPDLRVVLPDTGAARSELGALVGQDAPATEGAGPGESAGRVAGQLHRAGLVVGDDAALRAAMPGTGAGAAWERSTLAALARDAGEQLTSTVQRRQGHQITVHPFGHPLGHQLAADLVTLCTRSGLRLQTPRRPGPPPRRVRSALRAVVLVGVGEPRRDLVDRWLREGVPHLLVRLAEGRAVLGPFVVPGQTPCLRCIDAHLTDEDAAWPLLVEQYSRSACSDRPDGIPEPVDAALAALAVAWAARDLASYAEGGTPGTWGSTVRIAPRLETVETRRWPPHPRCGCGWG